MYEGGFNHYGKRLPSLRTVIDDLIESRTRLVSLQNLSHNTLEGDISRLNLFWGFLKDNFKQKDLDVSSFNTELLNQYMEYCRIERGNNSTTISNNMNVLRNLSNVLVDKNYIVENPFKKLNIPKPRKRGTDDIPHKEDYHKIKDFLEYWVDGYLNDEYEFELINTMIYILTKTGMRGGEIKMMKWEQGVNDIGYNHSFSYVYISNDFKKIGDFVGHGYQTMTELYTHLRSQDLEDISLSV